MLTSIFLHYVVSQVDPLSTGANLASELYVGNVERPPVSIIRVFSRLPMLDS
jgi:hypothetical protein